MADNKSCEGKVIGGKRVCGKTTRLLKQSSETGIRILCANKYSARILMGESKRLGLKVPPPLTPDVRFDFFEDVKEVLVDEVEVVLSKLIGKKITGLSSSMEFEELPSLRDSEPNSINKIKDITSKTDFTESIKGLKAIQREAKKATGELQ